MMTTARMNKLMRGLAATLVGGMLVMATSPVMAFAAVKQLHISQTTATGEANPPTKILVYDSNNQVVGMHMNDSGEAEYDLPESITSKMGGGATYTIAATAEGYSFTKMRGALKDDDVQTVSLSGIRTTSLNVKLIADGVKNFSYVTVYLYDGDNTNVDPRAKVSPSADGNAVFNDVPTGCQYTVKIVCPNSFPAQMPERTAVEVPAGLTETLTIEVKGMSASISTNSSQLTNLPSSVNDAAANSQTAAPESVTGTPQQEVRQTVINKGTIAQTGDPVVIIAVAAIGVAAVAFVIMAVKRK